MYIVLTHRRSQTEATRVSDDGDVLGRELVRDLVSFVASEEHGHPRWVWDDTSRWYPQLLAAGVRVDRCFDLRLCHSILRASQLTANSAIATASHHPWDTPGESLHMSSKPLDAPSDSTLFDFDQITEAHQSSSDAPRAECDAVAELALHLDAVADCAEPARLGRLLAAESAGALVAAEMRFAGLPWSAERHDQILTEMLGPRPVQAGTRPAPL
ncbi:MAG: bifunctional 3'-5' exonuclease/DNA polymerase, partial [Rhodoglobus sp.]